MQKDCKTVEISIISKILKNDLSVLHKEDVTFLGNSINGQD